MVERRKIRKYFLSIFTAIIFMALAYYYPAETVIGFFVGWLVIIPVAVAVFVIYGLRSYKKDINNSIVVALKPNEEMLALARKDKELQKEKELLLKDLQYTR